MDLSNMKRGWFSLDRINLWFLLIVLMISYAYFIPRWADQSANSRMDMIVAVVDQHTFQIDQYVKNTVDYAQYNGHYYSDKPPGTAFLGMPLYAAIKVVLNNPIMDRLVNRLSGNAAVQATLNPQGTGISTDKLRFAIAQVLVTYLLATLPSLALAWLLYRYLRKLAIAPGISAVVVLGYSLMTPAYAYATALYSHQLSAALLFGAFYLASDLKKGKATARLLAIGFLLGYAVISEYSVALIAGVIFLYALFQLKRYGRWYQIGWAILPGLVLVSGWMVYNKALFGSPFSFGYDYSTAWAVQHHTGFMSLTYPHLDAIWGITFSPYRGIFLLSPFLLMFFPGLITWWRSQENRPEWLVVVAVTVSMFLFNTSSIMWWGGFAIGPRYLLPALPFVVLSIGIFLKGAFRKAWVRVFTPLALLWSIVFTWTLTLAGQAFPSDVIQNPLIAYAIPDWQSENIARNLGTILGLKGLLSLIPLCLILIVVVSLWLLLARQRRDSLIFVPRALADQVDPSSY